MRAVFRKAIFTLSVLNITFLASCSVVDQYGDRSLTYNAEAFDTRSKLILSNILRAAYRQPLQFSEVSSVTGIASAGGTLGASLPVIGTGSSLSPQITTSGGPNFSFSNLSTQEFYQASSAELDNTTISLMLNQGFDPRLVFQLAISDIVITDKTQIKRVRMDFDNAAQFRSSFTAVTGLIKQGLTAKSTRSEKLLGPELNGGDAKLAALSLLGKQDITKGPSLAKNSRGRFEVTTSNERVVLCFDPTLFEQNNNIFQPNSNRLVVPLEQKRRVWLAVKNNGDADPQFTITLPSSYRCGTESPAVASPKLNSDDSVKLVFRMRSLQGIYEYLGSIARMQLGLSGAQDELGILGPEGTTYVFKVRPGLGRSGSVRSATNFGEFAIDLDPSGYDLSMQAIKAIAFLQALNSKATTLPTPVTTSVLVR